MNAASGAGQSLSDSTTLMSWTIELCKNESGEQRMYHLLQKAVDNYMQNLPELARHKQERILRPIHFNQVNQTNPG